jgi:hypothetical protein
MYLIGANACVMVSAGIGNSGLYFLQKMITESTISKGEPLKYTYSELIASIGVGMTTVSLITRVPPLSSLQVVLSRDISLSTKMIASGTLNFLLLPLSLKIGNSLIGIPKGEIDLFLYGYGGPVLGTAAVLGFTHCEIRCPYDPSVLDSALCYESHEANEVQPQALVLNSAQQYQRIISNELGILGLNALLMLNSQAGLLVLAYGTEKALPYSYGSLAKGMALGMSLVSMASRLPPIGWLRFNWNPYVGPGLDGSHINCSAILNAVLSPLSLAVGMRLLNRDMTSADIVTYSVASQMLGYMCSVLGLSSVAAIVRTGMIINNYCTTEQRIPRRRPVLQRAALPEPQHRPDEEQGLMANQRVVLFSHRNQVNNNNWRNQVDEANIEPQNEDARVEPTRGWACGIL